MLLKMSPQFVINEAAALIRSGANAGLEMNV